MRPDQFPGRVLLVVATLQTFVAEARKAQSESELAWTLEKMEAHLRSLARAAGAAQDACADNQVGMSPHIAETLPKHDAQPQLSAGL